jgi:predicted  nucleic acid-binding Zn ribbon protein
MNQELITKAKAAKSVEELLELAKASNVELSEEQAKEYFAKLNPTKGELSDDELDDVSGGGCGESKTKYCPNCNSELRMISEGTGNFSMKFYYLCDSCGYKEKQ